MRDVNVNPMKFKKIEKSNASIHVKHFRILKMVKGASAKRSPLPWRAGGKKQPVSPGAAYCAASTNSESPYWRRGVVLPQDPDIILGNTEFQKKVLT